MGVPFLVVGTKADLRDDETQVQALKEKGQYKTFDQYSAEALAIGAQKYLECSALKGQGLDEVFEEAIRAALKYKNKPAAGGDGKGAGKPAPAANSGGGGGCCIIS